MTRLATASTKPRFDRQTAARLVLPARGVRHRALALLASLGLLVVQPLAAQVEAVSGDFRLWTSAVPTWSAASFEGDFDGSAFGYEGTGCVSGAGPVAVNLGTMTLELPGGQCPVYDATSEEGKGADAQIPAGQALTLRFDPPVHGFYASFGSLAVDAVVTLRLLGADGLDQVLASPPSETPVHGRGFGFVSGQLVDRIEVSSTEPGLVLLGNFVGLVATEQAITRPGPTPCSSAACDYALAYELHRPGAFLTPTAGSGDLGSWPEAGGLDAGIDAGDAICRYWAQEAGYPEPNRFIAFLGHGDTEPLCRAVGLGGSYSHGFCDDVAVVPRMARWWRVDGLPFSAPLETPTNSGLFPRRPPLDVDGERSTQTYFTASRPQFSCDDWTNATTGHAYVGDPDSVDFYWLEESARNCAQENRLLCVERALGLPLPNESAAGRPVFITRATGPGDLQAWPLADASAGSGIEAADSICAAEAAAAGLDQPTSYRAWLSTSTRDAVDRLTEPGRYVRTDGVGLAGSIADLADGRIDTGIARHADGTGATALWAWTATVADGTFSGSSCGDWTSAAVADGTRVGSSGQAGSGWTDWTSGLCNFEHHLYCFSDADFSPVYADGFEGAVPGSFEAIREDRAR